MQAPSTKADLFACPCPKTVGHSMLYFAFCLRLPVKLIPSDLAGSVSLTPIQLVLGNYVAEYCFLKHDYYKFTIECLERIIGRSYWKMFQKLIRQSSCQGLLCNPLALLHNLIIIAVVKSIKCNYKPPDSDVITKYPSLYHRYEYFAQKKKKCGYLFQIRSYVTDRNQLHSIMTVLNSLSCDMRSS